ncbi:group II intron reverse transcriptase/maturase [Bacillus thuringiensis]|uniref:group II intron reverse transcriptase/maturase n=1 Tax=Bacillus thuringiensis TaxID=1428 RepID=UPI000BF6B9C8|nr:group II intron reverse transcriptase/maturase [Bacillus thuringiensis]PEQ27565.1 group II intron reverse transcriptase/maturase [Bacillus thuringiensis]
MNDNSKPTLKDKKLRHNEYYGIQPVLDNLYLKATKRNSFKSLMSIITSDENILLAFRNIKGNKGSKTSACDNVNIKDIGRMEQDYFLNEVKKRFQNYQPQKVRRKDIPKDNGKIRPLGIPSMWDRIIQQCILQVLEPICEAQFCTRSYGFRPNRRAEHAIADSIKKVNQQNLTYVVDVDIKGFFDEVNHAKLMRQLWTLGIRDKQLLVIIRKILKAPVQMPDGKTIVPTKGTPQGGILSPLLANVNLNEFDWWVSDQWETFKAKKVKPRYKDGIWSNDNVTNQLMITSKMKPMYIVRYADDFKIFTNTRSNAEKIFKASQMWLEERLKLSISTEKSKVTNLKRQESEFLGFTLKAAKKGKKKNGDTRYIAETHVSPKALRKTKQDLANQVKKIQKTSTSIETIGRIGIYNSMVIGKHNYYKIATHVNLDFRKISLGLIQMMYNRFPKVVNSGKRNTNGYTNIGEYNGKDKGIKPYLVSKQIRYLMKRPILPISYIQNKNPMMKKQAINKYTVEGRASIHKILADITETELKWLRENPVINKRTTVEYSDNRISLYVSQKGKCSVTGEKLFPWDMHCHHKKLWSETKDDSYKNLTIIKPSIHRLIHATKTETINQLLNELKLNEEQLGKLNKLRKLVENNEICIESQNEVESQNEQLALFTWNLSLLGETKTTI